MKRKTAILLAIGAIAIPAASALAANTAAFVPTKVFAGTSDGAVYIDGADQVAGCTSTQITAKAANADTAKTMNIAMAALLSGRKLICNVSGCDGSNQKLMGGCSIQ